MKLRAIAVSVALLVAMSACGKSDSSSSSNSSASGGGSSASSSDNPSGLDASRDLSAELKAMIEKAYGFQKDDQAKLRALAKTFLIPEQAAFFKKTFGDELGGKRAEGYAAIAAKLEDAVVAYFDGSRKENQSVITVVYLTKSDDPNAKGAQSEALNSMKSPVALYTVYMKAPGEDAGHSLWSWVYVDGGFRLMGK